MKPNHLKTRMVKVQCSCATPVMRAGCHQKGLEYHTSATLSPLSPKDPLRSDVLTSPDLVTSIGTERAACRAFIFSLSTSLLLCIGFVKAALHARTWFLGAQVIHIGDLDCAKQVLNAEHDLVEGKKTVQPTHLFTRLRCIPCILQIFIDHLCAG